MTSSQDYQAERDLRFVVEQTFKHAASAGIVPFAFPALVVAVSGGEDSHVLLHVLRGLQEKLQLRLVVCHVNHRLRDASENEAKFVETLCQRYSLPFHRRDAPSRPPQENIEAWCRRVRYQFLESVREETASHAILTAHHRNDQAETIIFRILTGRALTSARAIRELDAGTFLLRPLLNAEKSLIQRYRALHDLAFVTDESNFDISRTRNRIRHELLPTLARQYNPNLVEDLALAARRFGDDEEFLWDRAKDASERYRTSLTVEALRSLPGSLRWRVLAVRAEEAFGEDARRVGFHAYLAVLGLVERGKLDGPRLIELGFGYAVCIHPVNVLEFRKLP